MTAPGAAEVRTFLIGHLDEQLRAQGRSLPDEISDEYDLMLSGVIDSLGLLELVSALSEYCGKELDFEALDPEEMTIVGPLCRFVAAEAARGRDGYGRTPSPDVE